jgi:UDP-N-acetylglucosamine--N-acetylmuramyl-(pentapeptide) pyrophosphoryl-undecaprenol N-acetylglucosamine transferase
MKKVMIAAGGTGGHIYPALALAACLQRRDADCEVVFCGSRTRMEAQMIPARGYRFYGLDLKTTHGGILQKIQGVFSMAGQDKVCRGILKEEKPDAVVGFGNYISVPMVLAAHKLHIPTMISEQNSFLGKANRFLVRYADAVEVAYPASTRDLPAEKTRVLGNPQASEAVRHEGSPELLKQYGLDPERPFVFFMMGSLGSTSVSARIDEALDYLDEGFDVLIASGRANDYVFRNLSSRVHVQEFVDGAAMLKMAQLAVLRAGATTLAEAAALQAASILIPSPYVSNNEQVYNAMEFVRQGAAVMIEEKDLTGASLSREINRLMGEDEVRSEMKKHAGELAHTDAAEAMVDWLEELTR